MQNNFLPLITGLKRPSAFVYTDGDLFSFSADFSGDLQGDFTGDFSETSFFSLTSGSSQCLGLLLFSLSCSTYYYCFYEVPDTGWNLSGELNWEVLWGAAIPPGPNVTYDLALLS